MRPPPVLQSRRDPEDVERELEDGFADHRLRDLPGTLRSAPRRAVVAPAPGLDIFRALRRNLFQATVMSLLPIAVCLTVSTALWVAAGAGPIREGARATYTAETVYFDALTQGTQPVLQELQVLDGPVQQVETVYFAWADAPADHRRQAARTLLGVLNDQAVAARAVHGPAGSGVAPLLEPINTAYSETEAAYDSWTQAAVTLQGRAAVLSGMVSPPPDSMAIYAP